MLPVHKKFIDKWFPCLKDVAWSPHEDYTQLLAVLGVPDKKPFARLSIDEILDRVQRYLRCEFPMEWSQPCQVMFKSMYLARASKDKVASPSPYALPIISDYSQQQLITFWTLWGALPVNETMLTVGDMRERMSPEKITFHLDAIRKAQTIFLITQPLESASWMNWTWYAKQQTSRILTPSITYSEIKFRDSDVVRRLDNTPPQGRLLYFTAMLYSEYAKDTSLMQLSAATLQWSEPGMEHWLTLHAIMLQPEALRDAIVEVLPMEVIKAYTHLQSIIQNLYDTRDDFLTADHLVKMYPEYIASVHTAAPNIALPNALLDSV